MKVAEILLVEDNPGDVDLAREALERSKLFVRLHVVTDGEQAMLFLKREGPFVDAPKPDLILLDLNLPRKDGREVLEEIKQDNLLKAIPVVVLTSSKAEEDIARSYNLYANCYVVKPLDFKQFIQVVDSIKDFWLSIVVLPPENE